MCPDSARELATKDEIIADGRSGIGIKLRECDTIVTNLPKTHLFHKKYPSTVIHPTTHDWNKHRLYHHCHSHCRRTSAREISSAFLVTFITRQWYYRTIDSSGQNHSLSLQLTHHCDRGRSGSLFFSHSDFAFAPC